MKSTKLVSSLVISAAIAMALSACGPENVAPDTLETARTQSKANAEWNAQTYRAENPQFSNTAISAQTDSTQSPTCPQGDGWASVKLIDKGNPAAKVALKCSTVSSAVGCMTDAEFEKKSYSADDGRCQPTDKVPFPLPKLVK